MHRKFKISVDGHPYDVVVEEIVGEVAAPMPAGVTIASAVASHAPAAPVHAKPSAGAGDEVAPLAGVVNSVEVVIGQAVEVGTRIATIEAMKMKTEVFAKGAGKVAKIAVKAGDSVDSGGVLLTLA